jgi:hypothetical protein
MDGDAIEHVLDLDAREADDLFWFLSGEGSCALGLGGIDRLYDLLCARDGGEGRRWTFSEAERRELLEEMELQDCDEMTDEPVFVRLKAALLALGPR